MRIAIVGSRDFSNLKLVYDYIQNLPPNTIIISGGARGVDKAAEQWANKRKLGTIIFPADWDTYGKSAGYRRNHDIVNSCDKLVAFWDGESRGTANSIELANERHIPVEIIRDTNA